MTDPGDFRSITFRSKSRIEAARRSIRYRRPPRQLVLMKQRIDRCHRLGQENDVLSLAFINRDDLFDVRKLEFASKRTLVSDGVFGLTYSVLGDFTGGLKVGSTE